MKLIFLPLQIMVSDITKEALGFATTFGAPSHSISKPDDTVAPSVTYSIYILPVVETIVVGMVGVTVLSPVNPRGNKVELYSLIPVLSTPSYIRR